MSNLGSSDTPVEAESIETSQITDSADSQPFETLKEAGYEKGDYIPLIYGSGTSTGKTGTTSGTYEIAANNGRGVINWSLFGPSSGTAAVWFDGRVTELSGTTIDVRVYNVVDNEMMCEEVGISSETWFSIQPEEYTPTTDIFEYRTQIRSGDGSSEVELRLGSPTFGVRL